MYLLHRTGSFSCQMTSQVTLDHAKLKYLCDVLDAPWAICYDGGMKALENLQRDPSVIYPCQTSSGLLSFINLSGYI